MKEPEEQDMELVSRMADGDSDASDEFASKYRSIIMDSLGNRNSCYFSSEDAAQDTLMYMWKNAKKFRGASTVKTYVFGILRRIIAKQFKRTSPKILAASNNEHELPVGVKDSNGLFMPEAEAYSNEIRIKVNKAMPSLTHGQQEAIMLLHYRGMSQQEAAQTANCSIYAIKNRYRRACKKLSNLLSEFSS